LLLKYFVDSYQTFLYIARGIIQIEHIMLNGRKEKVNLLNGIKGFDL
jgi:hypothetical protein